MNSVRTRVQAIIFPDGTHVGIVDMITIFVGYPFTEELLDKTKNRNVHYENESEGSFGRTNSVLFFTHKDNIIAANNWRYTCFVSEIDPRPYVNGKLPERRVLCSVNVKARRV